MKRILASILALWFAYVPAHAGSMMLLGAGKASAGGGGGLTLTFVGTNTFSSCVSPTCTSASVPIGTAASDRIVVIVPWIGGNNTGGSTMTLNGSITATKDVEATINGFLVDIYQASVPTGTTMSISWNTLGFGGGPFTFAIYTITGASSSTPTGTGSNTSASASSLTTSNFSTTSNGVAIVMAAQNGANTLTMSGTTGTPTTDATPVPDQKLTSYRALSTSASTNYTGTWTGAALDAIVAAAWF